MTQLEINLLSVAMARISDVSKAEVTSVFEEFVDVMLQESSIGIGAESYVRGVLDRTLGSEKAERLAGRLNQGDYFAGIEAVQLQDPRVLAELIKAEHPQIVAMIFAYMEPEQADALIQFLPPEVRVSGGGVNMAAKILNRIDSQRVESILKQIGTVDPDLAQAIENSMLVFEDLARIDDRNFQILLRSIDQKLLTSALKGAEPKLLDKVMRNLSQRSAEMLKEEIGARGPMRVAEIEAARREIVATAQRLDREGTIMLPTDAGDLVT
jgi:flagellar motor switch protein FliG